MERRIQDQTRHPHGVITRRQLIRLGLSPGAVQRRIAAGRLERLHRAVYLVGPVLPPHARPLAAVLACGAAAVVSHRSAARLWTLLPAPESAAEPVQVSLVGGHGESRAGIAVHRIRALPDDERRTLHGIPLTSPARTLLDLAGAVALRGSGHDADPGRARAPSGPGKAGVREVEAALARAERERLVRPGEMEALVSRYCRRPGTPLLRRLLKQQHGPALTRSEAESRFLELVRRAGLPAPEANARLGGFEIDFLWRDLGVAVEVDGYRFHRARARFEGDRRRIARLASRGIQVIPLTWRQIVDDGTATAVLIGQSLVQAKYRR